MNGVIILGFCCGFSLGIAIERSWLKGGVYSPWVYVAFGAVSFAIGWLGWMALS